MAIVTAFERFSSEKTTAGRRFLQERCTEFDARFSRCYGLLQFVARRILGRSEDVADVVENCRVIAGQSSLEFEQEAAFRSWLVRVLIDEALAVFRKNRASNLNAGES